LVVGFEEPAADGHIDRVAIAGQLDRLGMEGENRRQPQSGNSKGKSRVTNPISH
jgi:hypothetical protein